MGKPLLFSLAGHLPHLDPRIHWSAKTASEYFDVTVAGVWSSGEPRSMSAPFRAAAVPVYERMSGRKRSGIRVPALIPFVLFNLKYFRFMLPMFPAFPDIIKGCMGKSRFPASYAAVVHCLYLLQTARCLIGFLKKAPEKPAVVLCNDLDTLLAGVWAKKRFNCRIIYDAHEYWPYATQGYSENYTRRAARLEKMLIPYADTHITVSGHLAREMERAYGLPSGRILTVPNAAPTEEAGSESGAGGPEPEPGRVYFLFQGNAAPHRGLIELIRAWPKLKSRRPVLVIRAPERPYLEELKRLARDLGVFGDTVRFAQAVSEDELIRAARGCDVGLIPYLPSEINHNFASPNKVSQYMQAGLALLSNNLASVGSLIREYGCGEVYDSSDEASLIEAITRLAQDAPLREAYARAARAAAKSYNWDKQNGAFIGAFKKYALQRD